MEYEILLFHDRLINLDSYTRDWQSIHILFPYSFNLPWKLFSYLTTTTITLNKKQTTKPPKYSKCSTETEKSKFWYLCTKTKACWDSLNKASVGINAWHLWMGVSNALMPSVYYLTLKTCIPFSLNFPGCWVHFYRGHMTDTKESGKHQHFISPGTIFYILFLHMHTCVPFYSFVIGQYTSPFHTSPSMLFTCLIQLHPIRDEALPQPLS